MYIFKSLKPKLFDPLLFTISEKLVKKGEMIIYDSFNGHLEAKDRLLFTFSGRAHLWSPDGILFDAPQKERFKQAGSIEDLALRTYVQKLVEIRALLPRATCHLVHKEYLLLDLLGKIVVGVSQWHVSRFDDHVYLLKLTPLKGYEEDLKHAEKELILAQWETCKGIPIKQTLDGLNIHPQIAPCSKPPTFPTSRPAGWVVPVVCLHFLGMIKENENGVIQDLDTEFLHDLRVASRKSRTILKLLRTTISEDLFKLGKSFLTQLGKATNELRDVDVYLLNQDEYQGMIPSSHQSFLEPFFQFLRGRRQHALGRVRSLLKSEEYARGFREFQVGLQIARNDALQGKTPGPVGNLPAGVIAEKAILERYNNIVTKGSLIHAETEDAALHNLRIECKRMRYLCDMFSCLFSEAIRPTIRNLKQLQNLLGDFNDLSVQELFFESYTRHLPLDIENRDLTLVAIGMLLGEFHQMKLDLRIQFFRDFDNFIGCGLDLIQISDDMDS